MYEKKQTMKNGDGKKRRRNEDFIEIDWGGKGVKGGGEGIGNSTSINHDGGDDIGEERELDQREQMILKEFEENDK